MASNTPRSAVDPPATPLAARSFAPPFRLRRFVCRRCVGNAGLIVACDGSEITACTHCASLKKPCLPVPKEYNQHVNMLARAAERGDEGADEQAVEFKRVLEKTLLKEERLGLRHTPKNVVEVGVLMLKELSRMNGLLTGIYDVMRAANGFPPVGDEEGRTGVTSSSSSSGDEDDDAALREEGSEMAPPRAAARGRGAGGRGASAPRGARGSTGRGGAPTPGDGGSPSEKKRKRQVEAAAPSKTARSAGKQKATRPVSDAEEAADQASPVLGEGGVDLEDDNGDFLMSGGL